MLVIGGRTNNVGENVPLEIYDCESSDWVKLPPIQRFRHACWVVDNILYVHGGFEQESPNVPTDTVAKLDISKILQFPSAPGTPPLNALGSTATLNGGRNPLAASPTLNNARNQSNESMMQEGGSISLYPGPNGNKIGQKPTTAGFSNPKNVRISDTVVIAVQHSANDDKNNLLRNIALDKLPEEPKKLRQGYNFKELTPGYSNNRSLYYESIYNPFLVGLLKPTRDAVQLNDNKFMFKKEQIIKLIDESINLLENNSDISTVLYLKIPIKIFGSLHGQYGDLMRIFDHWGAPTDNGDIEGFDYLFLGNYVDRGKYSLETLCVLFALKLKYPDQFHLLRGSHEDIKINRNFGFGEECANRLGEDINDPKSVFQRFNKLFEYLPLAAVIQDRILCIHSGIGSNVRTVQDIESINRPLEIVQDSTRKDHQIALDLLWSDPVQGDNDNGVTQSTSAYGIKNAIKFDADRLKGFLMENGLTMVVRSHECVIDGFERMWNGTIITLFSATDYCGKHTNAAAVVVIKKNFEVTPKIIYPSSASQYAGIDDDKGKYGHKTMGSYGTSSTLSSNSSWIDNDEGLKKRPATPPRYGGKGSLKKGM